MRRPRSLNVELELCKEFVVVVYIYIRYIHVYGGSVYSSLVRPHRSTGRRNDAQIRKHEMKVAAPIDGGGPEPEP